MTHKANAGASLCYKHLKKELKDYEIDKTLGKGAEGTVKLAKHKSSRERVVIKFFNVTDDIDEHLARRVSCHYQHTNLPIPHELNIIRILHDDVNHHENIVGLKEIFHKGSEWCAVLEYCSKGDMTRVIFEGPVTESYGQKLFRQLIEGVEYMHSRGVCHRDLKLDNLLLDSCGMLKISDFGTAEVFQAEGDDEYRFRDRSGTFPYMAPEVLNCGDEEQYDGCKADIWSCGVILLTLLTGKVMWENASIEDPNYCMFIDGKMLMTFSFDKLLKEFLEGILQVNPEKRFTISQIKSHEWFKTRSLNGVHSSTLEWKSKPTIKKDGKGSKDYLNLSKEMNSREGLHVSSQEGSCQSKSGLSKSGSHGSVSGSQQNIVTPSNGKLIISTDSLASGGSEASGEIQAHPLEVSQQLRSKNSFSNRLSRTLGSLKKILHRPRSENNMSISPGADSNSRPHLEKPDDVKTPISENLFATCVPESSLPVETSVCSQDVVNEELSLLKEQHFDHLRS